MGSGTGQGTPTEGWAKTAQSGGEPVYAMWRATLIYIVLLLVLALSSSILTTPGSSSASVVAPGELLFGQMVGVFPVDIERTATDECLER